MSVGASLTVERDERKRTKSDPASYRMRRRREFTKDHPCEVCEPRCERVTYAWEPLARIEGRTVWSCQAAYMRGYRAVQKDPELLRRYQQVIG